MVQCWGEDGFGVLFVEERFVEEETRDIGFCWCWSSVNLSGIAPMNDEHFQNYLKALE